MKKTVWYCERQRAGDLVKICKGTRPRRSRFDDVFVRAEKNAVLRSPLRSSVRRTPADRVELMLALMGRRTTHYVLTYRDPFLPANYREARLRLGAFIGRIKRFKKCIPDYVYAIEGKHGDHRYHLHMILRDDDFSVADVEFLWGYGDVEVLPVLRTEKDTYWRTAKYITKERTDGVVFPLDAKTWGCSAALRKRLPMLETWKASSGKIWIPKGAVVRVDRVFRNPFGEFHYVVYQKGGGKREK